ncbi:MAG: 50S ribosomal protein L15 [Patescibacteria group bacterium]|nr:50S ribosomal protein L15 [Patescibacteria group bacterium]
MELFNLKPVVKRKARKRVGRGNAAGQGTFAGRGGKGQTARSGGSIRPGFEGGRTTLIMQTPKLRGKGFRSLSPEAEVVKVSELNVFTNAEKVTFKSLKAKGLVDREPVKILAGGTLTKELEVMVPVSASAREVIEKAGGKVIAESSAEKKE